MAQRKVMRKKGKDNAVFRHSVVKTKKINVTPYHRRGGIGF